MIEKLKNLGTELVSRGMSSKIVKNHTPKNDYIIDFSSDILSNFYTKLVKVTDTEFFANNLDTDYIKIGKDFADNAFISKNQLNKPSQNLKSQIDDMVDSLLSSDYWIEGDNIIDPIFDNFVQNKIRWIREEDRLSNIHIAEIVNDEEIMPPDLYFQSALNNFTATDDVIVDKIHFFTQIEKRFEENEYYYYRGEPFKSNIVTLEKYLTAPTSCLISNPFSKKIEVGFYLTYPQRQNRFYQKIEQPDEKYKVDYDSFYFGNYDNRKIKKTDNYSTILTPNVSKDVIIEQKSEELDGCDEYGIDYLSVENQISSTQSTSYTQYDMLEIGRNKSFLMILPQTINPHSYFNFNLFWLLTIWLMDYYNNHHPYDIVYYHQEIKHPNVTPRSQVINFYENAITTEDVDIKIFFRFVD